MLYYFDINIYLFKQEVTGKWSDFSNMAVFDFPHRFRPNVEVRDDAIRVEKLFIARDIIELVGRVENYFSRLCDDEKKQRIFMTNVWYQVDKFMAGRMEDNNNIVYDDGKNYVCIDSIIPKYDEDDNAAYWLKEDYYGDRIGYYISPAWLTIDHEVLDYMDLV